MGLAQTVHLHDAAVGAVAGLAAAGVALLTRTRPAIGPPALALAVAGALWAVGEAPPALPLVVAVLAALGLALTRWPVVVAVGAAGAAALLAPGELPALARVGGGGMVLLASIGAAEVSRRAPQAVLVGLVAMTAAGIWAAVPDTEAPVVVLAALAPVLVVAAFTRRAVSPLTAAPLAVVVLDVAWAALWGARGRPGALPGALACAGVLLLVPLLRRPFPQRIDSLWMLAGCHAAVVVLTARWASRTSDVWVGAARSALVLGVAAFALALAGRRASADRG